MTEIVSVIVDTFGRKIRLTKERLNHILKRNEMKEQENNIKNVLSNPDEVRKSRSDPTVYLYYKHFPKLQQISEKYLVVLVKVLNTEGFIISSYFSDKVKKGEIIWTKNCQYGGIKNEIS